MQSKRFAILFTAINAVLIGNGFAQQADSGLNVSLPLKELRGLLEREKPPELAPVDVVFGVVTNSLDAGEKIASVTTTAELTLPNPKWVSVTLGAGTGVTSVTIDDQPASVIQRDGKLVAVIDARVKRTAKIKISRQLNVRAQSESSSLSIPLLPAPLATLTAKLPAGNLNVKAPELSALRVESTPAGTTFNATLPQADSVTLQWSTRDARPARVTAQHLNHVIIDRGLIRYTATLQYDILRAPIERLQLRLPEGVDLTRVTSEQMADFSVDEAAKPRLLTVQLKEPAQGSVRLTIEYEQRLNDGDLKPALAMVRPIDLAGESGYVGIEVRGNYEVTPEAVQAERMDVARLPDLLTTAARSPIRFAYRFDKPGATFTASLKPLQDLDVLIAMSDISEVSTTITPEGKVMTKVIMIVRNNQKSHLRVTLPEGSQLWSAFVDDRPVTPSKDATGEVLLPLRKSAVVDADDDDNYVNKRSRRRQEGAQQQMQQFIQRSEGNDETEVADLKPYDVELVYISPDVVLAQRGQIKLSLPKIDIPVGRLAWAVFVPPHTRVVDAGGNVREVERFSLPFTHFGETSLRQSEQLAKAAQAAQQRLDTAGKAQLEALQGVGAARAKGVLPVRIEMPIFGQIHRFEKLLSVNEMPTIELSYVKRE